MGFAQNIEKYIMKKRLRRWLNNKPTSGERYTVYNVDNDSGLIPDRVYCVQAGLFLMGV